MKGGDQMKGADQMKGRPTVQFMRAIPDVDLTGLRPRFPSLSRQHNGHPVAYLDGPGGTQVPQSVVDAMSDYLLHHNANTHWQYPTSEETDRLIADSRETVADFLNAGPEEVVFGANMTTLTFHLARALARGWKAGDEVVLTELDHHGNVAPWKALAKEKGIVIRTARMDPATGTVSNDEIGGLIGDRTKLVAVGAASNALGTISDVASVTQLAHRHGAEVFVDAVHYAPHQLVDVRIIDCDYLACSAYKFYGPHIGILYGKRARLDAVDFPRLDPAPQEAPERAETGTQNHEGIVGAAAAVDFLASFAPNSGMRRDALLAVYDTIHFQGTMQVQKLWGGLSTIDRVTLYGPKPGTHPRTPTVSFTMKGMKTNDIARALAKDGLFVSNGDFYAATVIERIGQGADGVVRVGCSCYTTMEDIDRLLDAVRELAAT
jgi:cysteine desulfurase family protein (TIGR01976 family)